MNYALIFAGGRGERMNTKSRPKQFLELHGKPIIIYTLEQFDAHPLIDGIVVVILGGWEDYLRKLLKKFAIEKVVSVVSGGSCGQESIWNGLVALSEFADEDSVILIHDGVRPLIDSETISANIESVRSKGSAITVTPAIETVFLETDSHEIGTLVDRDKCYLARAPQSYYFKDVYNAYEMAKRESNWSYIDSATLMKHYGASLHMVHGPKENIKITNASDFYVFRAICDALENQQLFGA